MNLFFSKGHIKSVQYGGHFHPKCLSNQVFWHVLTVWTRNKNLQNAEGLPFRPLQELKKFRLFKSVRPAKGDREAKLD